MSSALPHGRRPVAHAVPDGRQRVARAAVLVAAVAGLLHAASSSSWALGSRWLLPTVGGWAVEAGERDPVGSGLLLGGIGAVKTVAALLPLGLDRGRVGWAPFWRTVCWVGGAFLVVYASVTIAVSVAVLFGMIRPEGGHDEAAMIGHAFLWDPLFLVWGLALLLWLLASRRRRSGSSQGDAETVASR